jgi:hypothetical protein
MSQGDDCKPRNETATDSNVPLNDFREKYLQKIIQTIEDEKFRSNYSLGKSFIRCRKLPFNFLIVLLMTIMNRAIQRELNTFYAKIKGGDFSIHEATKSALTHARKKLKAEAFIELNRVGIESFYREASYLKWNNFRLLAVDGSTIVLPNHKTITEEFGTIHVGPNADQPKHMARISILYDLLNFTVLHAEMGPYHKCERDLAYCHLPAMKPGEDLVIMDRGYGGFTVAFELQKKGIDYCIRSRDDWWPEVKEMLKNGETDKIVNIKKNQQFEMFPKMKLFYDELICRIVIITLPNDGIEILITSLLDDKKFPYESFVALYQKRWLVEEGYKLFKSRIHLEAFSGKTAIAIKQDFFAKVFLMTTTAVLAFPLEEQLKKEQAIEKKKHEYKINRTNALSFVKDSAPNIFIKKFVAGAINAFDNILRATVEIVRPGRKEKRNHQKRKPPSMNYKQL